LNETNTPAPEYPESDYPWTFYFNGVEMPRFANCWGECNAGKLMHDFCRRCWPDPEEFDAALEENRFFQIEARIDHGGTIESFDPLEFRMVSLRLLLCLLIDEEQVVAHLTEHFPSLGRPADVFRGVCDGIFKMNQLVAQDGIAFWSAGYKADGERLREAIRRHRLPPGHADYLEAPHLERTRRNDKITIEFLRKDVLKLVQKMKLSKDMRSKIHNIPRAWNLPVGNDSTRSAESDEG
jgi:hypothetical protein